MVRSTEYRDRYFRIAPRFESGDPRCAWLNESIFVAEELVNCGCVAGCELQRAATSRVALPLRDCGCPKRRSTRRAGCLAFPERWSGWSDFSEMSGELLGIVTVFGFFCIFIFVPDHDHDFMGTTSCTGALSGFQNLTNLTRQRIDGGGCTMSLDHGIIQAGCF